MEKGRLLMRSTEKALAIFIIASGLLIGYPTPISNDRILSTNASLVMMCFLWACGIISFYKNKPEVKVSLIDLLVGILMSGLYVTTNLLSAGQEGDNVSGLFFAGKFYLIGGNSISEKIANFGLTSLSFLSWMIFLTFTVRIVRYWFENITDKTNETFSYRRILLFILVSWGVLALIYYPGQISWDAMRQFCEYEGTKLHDLNFQYIPTNHQPWFATLIFGTLFSIGRIIDTNFGIFIVILFQLLITALIYAKATQYVSKKLGILAGQLTLILFASPIFGTYAITIDKSTLSYGLGVAFFMLYLRVIEDLQKNSLGWKSSIAFIFVAFLFAQFRNDSKYAVILAMLLLLIWVFLAKMQKSKLIVGIIILVTLFFGWKQYSIIRGVVNGSVSEALTIPTRQLSYVYLHHKNELSAHDIKIINDVTDTKRIRTAYNVNQGDRLKDLYPVNTFLDNTEVINGVVKGKIDLKESQKTKDKINSYLKLWGKELFKYPGEYVAVYLAANSRYFNPMFGLNGSGNGLFLNFSSAYPYPKYISPSWREQFKMVVPTEVRNLLGNIMELIIAIPPLAIFVNCGLIIWLMILLTCVILSRKQYVLLLPTLPILLLIAMYTLSPVNGYSRYTLGVVAILPVYLSYIKQRLELKKGRIDG